MKGFLMSILMVLLFTVSCDKKDDTAEKEMGSLGGKCYPAGNCDEDLVCEDGVCVKDDSVITDDDFETQDEVETEDSDPVDLCDPNPCTMNNSDGECTVEGEDYFCGCEENYTWDGEEKKCSPDIRRTECTNEIPENASYSGDNSDGKFEQVWDGSRWLPEDYSCLWECDEDFFEEDDHCINTRVVICDNSSDYPDNSEIFDDVEVEITYTTDEGWEDVPQCEWECEEGYVKYNGSCVQNKMVDCLPNPDKPENSVDVIELVEITYTEEDGWTTPELCENWECDTDYAEENGACINSKMADCLPNPDKPLRSVDVVEPVEITYTDEDGWSEPAKCVIWECVSNYVFEDGACINSKMVDCIPNPDKPENSVDVIEPVEITYTEEDGWAEADFCENWECDTDYTEEEGECINSKMVDCLPNPDKPENSVDIIESVEITYTTDDGWMTADFCENWECAYCFILSPSGEECNFQTVVHVKHDAEGEETGITWEDAYKDLGIAIENACEGQDIWVAEGVYLPTMCRLADGSDCDDNRILHFSLRNNIAIYGGFDGDSYDFNDRDREAYETILSGEFDEENAYHVIYNDDLAELNETAILDGFIITGGNADGDEFPHNVGGGIFNGQNSNPTIRNCVFYGNSATLYGGAIYNHLGAGAVIENTVFVNNSVLEGSGSAIYSSDGILFISGTHFAGNYAFERGAVYADKGEVEIYESRFTDNFSGTGGGAFVSNESSVLIQDTFFEGNQTDGNGGAILNRLNSLITLINCVFKDNLSLEMGGAIANFAASSYIRNCTLSRNNADEGGSIANGGLLFPVNSISWDNHSVSFADEILHLSAGSEVDGLVLGEVYSSVSYSNIAGCGASGVDWNEECGIDRGGNIDADPLFVGSGDHPLMLSATSPCIDAGNNDFIDGILTDILGNPRIVNDIVDMGAYEYQ